MSTGAGDTAPVLSSELMVHTPRWTDRQTVELTYQAGAESFIETIRFPESVVVTGRTKRLVDLLAIAAGVSYSKAVGALRIVPCGGVDVTPAGIELSNALYDQGMREFALTNGLPIPTGVQVVVEADAVVTAESTTRNVDRALDDAPQSVPNAVLIPFGAGRDSTMLAARLAPLSPILFKVGSDVHSVAVADSLGLRLAVAERRISPRLLELNAAGAPNGHVPVTAINSLIAVVFADSIGVGRVAMANERASSSPTAIVDGHQVNHQFSKSAEAENLLRAAIAETGSPVDYFSALRSWSDDQIGAAFASLDPTVQQAFMSCNRAFVRDPARRSERWCGTCPKCASTFLSLAPHLPPERIEAIFGRNLAADDALVEVFRGLVSESDKPFECVADVDEARFNLGLLANAEEWVNTPIVTELAAYAASTAPDLSAIPGDDHHVPDDIRVLLSEVTVP